MRMRIAWVLLNTHSCCVFVQALSQVAFRFDQVSKLCTEVFALQSKYDLKLDTSSGGVNLQWECMCTRTRSLIQLEFLELTWRSLAQPLRFAVDAIVGEVGGCFLRAQFTWFRLILFFCVRSALLMQSQKRSRLPTPLTQHTA
jgi:hypothetical protein